MKELLKPIISSIVLLLLTVGCEDEASDQHQDESSSSTSMTLDTLFEGKKITQKESKVSVGLINVPCGGFGDIVNCKTFSDYLKSWYPNMQIRICTSSIQKFQSIGIQTKQLIELVAKNIYDKKNLTYSKII